MQPSESAIQALILETWILVLGFGDHGWARIRIVARETPSAAEPQPNWNLILPEAAEQKQRNDYPADYADICRLGAQANPGIWFYRR
jgi:hypothetical protein